MTIMNKKYTDSNVWKRIKKLDYKPKNQSEVREFVYNQRITQIFKAQGRDDKHCVYVQTKGDSTAYIYTDAGYFDSINKIAVNENKADELWDDFFEIFNLIDGTIKDEVVDRIYEMAHKYENDNDFRLHYMQLYYTMDAEWHKGDSYPLKHRVKALGMHQFLKEGMSPREAANFSWGKNADYLDKLMKERGF